MGWGAYVLGGCVARRLGSESALDKCSKHHNCSGVVLGRLEVQGFREGLSAMLAGGAARQGMFGGPISPWDGPRFWAMPIGVAQRVGGSQ